MPSYSYLAALDEPEFRQLMFYPRRDTTPPPPEAIDYLIPVAQGIALSARFHIADKTATSILLFHGNGEVVSDYDEVAPLYRRLGVNLCVVDYRGYGASGGAPSFTSMLGDAHKVLNTLRRLLAFGGYSGPLIVMGRSLGSASAVALARHHTSELRALIVESGFASITALFRRFGLQIPELVGGVEPNIDAIRKVTLPSLIIHGERDSLIPLSAAKELYSNAGTAKKRLVVIPNADHNNVMVADSARYFGAIGDLVRDVASLS